MRCLVLPACSGSLSTQGYDAIHKPSGSKEEIKAIQGKLIAVG